MAEKKEVLVIVRPTHMSHESLNKVVANKAHIGTLPEIDHYLEQGYSIAFPSAVTFSPDGNFFLVHLTKKVPS